ncbi:hypothetical protein GRP75_08900 [Paenibacillus sp. OT2-17]|nr:hypothetical protein [Paenibacillus sp. OT2-17]
MLITSSKLYPGKTRFVNIHIVLPSKTSFLNDIRLIKTCMNYLRYVIRPLVKS